MCNHAKGKSGFTLVEIMIVVAIIGVLSAVALPNFVKARNNSFASTCIDNLRQVDSAMQQWALEYGMKDTDAVDAAQVATYMRGQSMPACPTGVPYVWGGTVGTIPSITCPLGATVTPPHILP